MARPRKQPIIINKFYTHIYAESRITGVQKAKYHESYLTGPVYVPGKLELTNPFQSQPITLTVPEVDGIKFRYSTQLGEKIFTRIKAVGHQSSLIDHFVECEANNLPYSDPITGEVLMKKQLVVPNSTQNFDPFYYLYPPGGYLLIRRIVDLDNDLFHAMIGCCLSISGLYFDSFHLAADYDIDLMGLVGENLKTGKYETQNVKAYAFGFVGAEEYSNLWSKKGSKFQENKGKEIKLKSVYFGTSQKSPFSVLIYDKAYETLKRKAGYFPSTTRIEVRAHYKNNCPLTIDHASDIVASMEHSTGYMFRALMLNILLNSVVTFTRVYERRGEFDNDIADWYYQLVLQPLSFLLPSEMPKTAEDFLDNNYILPWIESFDKPIEVRRPRGRPKGSKDKTRRKPREYTKRENRSEAPENATVSV